MRRDCVLSTLTEDQQADLFDWLSTDTYEAVQKRLAQPPPEGFGIKAHLNTLFRFYEQRQAQNRARDLANAAAALHSQASDRGAQDSFLRASRLAHAHSTYLLSHSPSNPARFRAVSRVLQHHEDTILKRDFLDVARQQLVVARERLQLQRQEFEYDAARAALAVLPELNKIARDPALDDQAKLNRVRQRLFGLSATSSPAIPLSGNSAPSVLENDSQ